MAKNVKSPSATSAASSSRRLFTRPAVKPNASSRLAQQTETSAKSLPPLSPAAIKRLKALAARPDSEIDYSDIPPLTEAWFKKALYVPAATRSGNLDFDARVKEAMKDRQKKPISLRVEPSVLKWFKAQGKGYQSLMNAVLKSYMETQKT